MLFRLSLLIDPIARSENVNFKSLPGEASTSHMFKYFKGEMDWIIDIVLENRKSLNCYFKKPCLFVKFTF